MVVPSVVSWTETPMAERENGVDQRLAEFGLAGELMIEVQRLWIVGQRREHEVVHLGDGTGQRMFEHLSDFKLFEIQSCHVVLPGLLASPARSE